MDKTKEIITELKRSYAIELEAMENFLTLSIDLEGGEAEPVRKSLEEEIALKLKHARRLAKRINVLGGRLPGSLGPPVALPSRRGGVSTPAQARRATSGAP